jgi:hypothetical protein
MQSQPALPSAAIELYRLLGHEIINVIPRSPDTHDLIIRGQDGARWVARCCDSAEVSLPTLHAFLPVLQTERAAQAALITTGVVAEDVRQTAHRLPLHILDGNQFRDYLEQARRLVHPATTAAEHLKAPAAGDADGSEMLETDWKKCPYCAETIRREAVLCRFCGRSLTAAETSMHAMPAEPAEPRSQEHRRPNGPMLLGLVGAVLMGLGTFLPFVRMPVVGSLSYFNNGQGDGLIIVFLAGGITIFLLLRWYLLALIPGLVAGGIVGNAVLKISRMIREMNDELGQALEDNPFAGFGALLAQSVQIDVGAYIMGLGIGIVVVATLWGLGDAYARPARVFAST